MSRRAGTPTAKKVTQLVNVEEHVEGFRQVREAHRRELIDDYVELISDLIREVGEARQVDMAARLGVPRGRRPAYVGTGRKLYGYHDWLSCSFPHSGFVCKGIP